MKQQQKLTLKISDNNLSLNTYNQFRQEVLDISQDHLIGFNSRDQAMINRKIKNQLQSSPKENSYLDRDVPIYRIQSKYDFMIAGLSQSTAAKYFAHGDLFGRFYQSSQLLYLANISFIGNFYGMFDWQSQQERYPPVYFEGNIRKLSFLTTKEVTQNKHLNKISLTKSSFQGYFKGHFYPFSLVGGIDNINDNLAFKDINKIPLSFNHLKQASLNKKAQYTVISNKKTTEYNLPTLVCFQIMNIGNINLQKSSAVVNGNLIIQIKYNSFIEQIFASCRENKEKLSIALHFNRDITLFLPVQEQEDMNDSDNDSQWSLQQKNWDIELTKDKKNKILHYKIVKKLKAQIDSAYGGFFAPFNLSQLRIVIHFSSIPLHYKSERIKLNFVFVDTFDYEQSNKYNPYSSFNSLSQGALSLSQINRFHKINRRLCSDNGEYIIADNHLALYPHFKSILKNKSFINSDALWYLGFREYLPLLQPALASRIPDKYYSLVKQFQESEGLLMKKNRLQTFSFLTWDNVIIEIPIYKYIVIDMLKIFLPLTIVTALSLFIFNQENGKGHDSNFTTLAYRLANVAAIAITFSSLIPITLKSLPPMPGITLVEIIIYLQAIPSFLAIINSMIYYNISLQQWRRTYKVMNDGVFIFGFIISVINFIIISAVFLIYMFTQYTTNRNILQYQQSRIQWRSPLYLKFIQSVMKYKSEYYNIVEQNV